MGLSASLYSGVTGLLAHSERMSVIGDNLSNVNTTAYKSSSMLFEDFFPQDINTASGVSQVGRGVSISAVYSDFSQGSFQSTNSSTDLAIGGNGFFVVKKQGTDETYYTRAGSFTFNKSGYLVDPNGLVVQGWKVQNESTSTATTQSTSSNASSSSVKIVGVPVDVQLQNFQSSPQQTGHVDMITNLDSNSTDQAKNTTDPDFAMFKLWTSQSQQLSDNQYSYSSTIKVYDANGATHNLTVYMDPATMSNTGGNRVWEYMVTCPPSEDGRVLSGASGQQSVNGTGAAGVLMIGTLTFNSSGQITNMSSYTLQSNAAGGDLTDLNNWRLAAFSKEGYPETTANFLNASNASTTDAYSVNAQLIDINFGVTNKSLQGSGATKGWTVASGTASNAGSVGSDYSHLAKFQSASQNALATTDYSTGSSTLYQSQDGYGSGFLQSVTVDKNGILSGKYSNGQVLELYALTLANFNNDTGLRREGGNLFSATKDSGPALTGTANTGTLGSVSSNSLEQSNVDMASAMVDMIVTQRGFQANSKTITTVDSMLSDLIQLKR